MVHKKLKNSVELFAKYEFLKGNSPAQASWNFYETKTGGTVESVPREDANDLPKEPTSSENDPEFIDSQKPKRATVVDLYCSVSSQVIDKNIRKIADQKYKKNMKNGKFNSDIKPDDCLDLLLMLKLYDVTQRDSLKNAFRMNRVIVTRAYGKVKVQIFNLNDSPLNTQYWRCQNEQCLFWKGYRARFDKTSRFQLLASIHLYYVLHKAKLDVLEFKTEEYQSWNPKFDPFFYILKSLKSEFESDMGSIKAQKLIMEIGWYGDSGEKNQEQLKDVLKLLESKHLESIKLRKWKSVEKTKEMREAHEETIKIFPSISNMDQWRKAKELDIQDEDIHLNKQDFMDFKTVHIHLKTGKILDFCEMLLKTDFRKPEITFIVDELFDFKTARNILEKKFGGTVRYEMPENRSLELVSENFQVIYRNEKSQDRGVGVRVGAACETLKIGYLEF